MEPVTTRLAEFLPVRPSLQAASKSSGRPPVVIRLADLIECRVAAPGMDKAAPEFFPNVGSAYLVGKATNSGTDCIHELNLLVDAQNATIATLVHQFEILSAGTAPVVDLAAQIQSNTQDVRTLRLSLGAAAEASLDKRLPSKVIAQVDNRLKDTLEQVTLDVQASLDKSFSALSAAVKASLGEEGKQLRTELEERLAAVKLDMTRDMAALGESTLPSGSALLVDSLAVKPSEEPSIVEYKKMVEAEGRNTTEETKSCHDGREDSQGSQLVVGGSVVTYHLTAEALNNKNGSIVSFAGDRVCVRLGADPVCKRIKPANLLVIADAPAQKVRHQKEVVWATSEQIDAMLQRDGLTPTGLPTTAGPARLSTTSSEGPVRSLSKAKMN
ncbi:unnamed protein product [Prorocentrum cordatum]|uniref:Uncharacterized protein n=1 Tax=Prorocentrum cordatum TaxID=2364126 RepID=A0ABN9RYX0_9DINO|nr:unnamed protein product [Polarella glacialis]